MSILIIIIVIIILIVTGNKLKNCLSGCGCCLLLPGILLLLFSLSIILQLFNKN